MSTCLALVALLMDLFAFSTPILEIEVTLKCNNDQLFCVLLEKAAPSLSKSTEALNTKTSIWNDA